ncbi:MAG TPA: efflux RND transporter permease subunit [Bacteroidota bacterium]|nr:efflux RND transporter permease subunit [Bacteroidota bacterium]
MSLFDYVRRHARAILFTVAVLAASGVALLQQMPVSLFPDITFPRIVILADNGEEPAERMMIQVTKPLEEAASSVPGVRLVRSSTSRGTSEISVSLDWGSDVQQTLQLIQGRIANIRSALPAGAGIQIEQMQVSVMPILGYSLTSDSISLVDLRDIALYHIRPALMRVRGVARVEVTGGDVREFRVTVSPEKLAGYHLDMRAVSDAVEKSNLVSSGGLVDNNYQLYLSLVSGLYTGISDIESCVVAVRDGVPVKIKDIADVHPGVADKYIRTTAHGREAVLVSIMKQPTGSTVQIGSDVIAELATLRLPRGVQFENFYDQGGFIKGSIHSTRDSIVVGILLAMVVLLVFLRSWRVALVIAIVVPVTIACTVVCLYAVGKTINIMTLGGIAAAVGLIIDDSIVILENVFAHFASRNLSLSGESSIAAVAGQSLRELMPAIIGSTASTIVIHIPLAFLGGVTGAFFTSLSVTMVFALLISFLFSITLAPLLASFVIRRDDVAREVARHERSSSAGSAYARILRRLLAVPWVVVPAACAIALATYWFYGNIGSDFMPDMDEGTFVLDYSTPPGTSLTETDRVLTKLEGMLMSIPEVESYSRRTGTQLGFFITEPNQGDYLVKLKAERSRRIDEVIADVRSRIAASEPSLRVDFGQLMMDVIGDLTNNPSPIEIKIFGSDERLLHQKAEEVRSLIAAVPGVVDAFNGIVISGPSLVVHVDPLRASLAGLSVSDVQEELGTVIQGRAPNSIQKGEKLIPVRVRYPEAYHYDMERIQSLRLATPSGGYVPLGSVATIEKTEGQAELRREGLRPLASVTARISGRDLGGTISDIQKTLRRSLNVPSDMTIVYGGVYETQQESFRGLLLVSLAAVSLVFIVLLFEFGEFAVPLSILIINVLSLLGVFGALWITGVTFNISSFVGIILIIGIVAENAIFVMHNVKRLVAVGTPLNEALVEATRLRTRPIIMTALAAVFALLPLSLGLSAGSQMQQPLAIAVIGGFSLSSLLLFFALPLIYRLMKRA